LQIITNGRLLGAEHRVVTNSTSARTSVAYFIYPSFSRIIEPAQELVDIPIYKSMSFGEFRKSFYEKGPKIEQGLSKH
jgi:isopenicillin N synthase-like dioxygenase